MVDDSGSAEAIESHALQSLEHESTLLHGKHVSHAEVQPGRKSKGEDNVVASWREAHISSLVSIRRPNEMPRLAKTRIISDYDRNYQKKIVSSIDD